MSPSAPPKSKLELSPRDPDEPAQPLHVDSSRKLPITLKAHHASPADSNEPTVASLSATAAPHGVRVVKRGGAASGKAPRGPRGGFTCRACRQNPCRNGASCNRRNFGWPLEGHLGQHFAGNINESTCHFELRSEGGAGTGISGASSMDNTVASVTVQVPPPLNAQEVLPPLTPQEVSSAVASAVLAARAAASQALSDSAAAHVCTEPAAPTPTNPVPGFVRERQTAVGIYTGQVGSDGQPHGLGRAVAAESRFEGHWAHALPAGTGVYGFKNGDAYCGQVHGGKLEGFGVLTFGNGTVFYEGQWVRFFFSPPTQNIWILI